MSLFFNENSVSALNMKCFWAAAAPYIASFAGAAVSSYMNKDSGGGGGGGSGSQSTLTPSQTSLLDKLNPLLEEQLGQGIDMSDAPWKSPTQQMVYDMLPGMISGQDNELYQQSQQSLGDIIGAYDPQETQDFWESNVVNKAMEQWEDNIVPRMDEMFVSRNAMSSGARNRALAESGRKLTTDLSSQLGNLLRDDKRSHAQEQMQAIPTAANLNTMQLQNMQKLLGLGTAETSAEMAMYQAQQPYANPWLEQLRTGLGVQGVAPYYQQQGQASPNAISGLLGNSQFMGGIGNAIGSYYGGGGGGGGGGAAIGNWAGGALA